MSYPAGVRDGPFIRYDDWDITGNDIGQYFANLSVDARLAALKQSCLEYGSRFFAFTDKGWAKSWASIGPASFVQVPGATLYIRVEYPGWSFYPRTLSTFRHLEHQVIT